MHNRFKAFLFFLLVLSISCNDGRKDIPASVINNPATASGKPDTGALPVMSFRTEEHDFGKVHEGETVSYGFVFKNTGKGNLVISSVSTSCGCTVTDYPKDAIKVGDEKMVTVSFKTEGKRGFQQKTVTVMANTVPNTKTLTIKAQVLSTGDTEQ